MTIHSRFALVVLPLLLSACAIGAAEPTESGASLAADAPLVGVDGSGDSADTSCNVVLRSMMRIPNNTGGYVTRGSGSWVWRAVVDVADAAAGEGGSPSVLYKPAGSDGWKSVVATQESKGDGFTRFVAEVWEGMPAEGMSGTALRSTRVPVIPYLKLADGGRLFDHNRIADPMGSYVISGEAGLAIGEDASICTAAPGAGAGVGWMGNAVAAIGRDGGACDGVPLGQGFSYDTWVRQRATKHNICFEVWKEGVTDRDNPDLWRDVDVQVHYRYSASEPWQTAYVNIFDRVGNNARYALDLASLDPFRPGYCTTEPYTSSPDGQYDQAGIELYFTANGTELKASESSSFTGTYLDYPVNHCP